MFTEFDMQDFFSSKNTGNTMASLKEQQKEGLKMQPLCVVEDFCAFLQN